MPAVGVAAFPAAGFGAGDALCAAAAPLCVRTAGTGRRYGGIAQGAHGFAVLQRVLQLAVKDVPDHIGQADRSACPWTSRAARSASKATPPAKPSCRAVQNGSPNTSNKNTRRVFFTAGRDSCMQDLHEAEKTETGVCGGDTG